MNYSDGVCRALRQARVFSDSEGHNVTSIDISPDGSQVLLKRTRQKYKGGDRFILYMRVLRERKGDREREREGEFVSLFPLSVLLNRW